MHVLNEFLYHLNINSFDLIIGHRILLPIPHIMECFNLIKIHIGCFFFRERAIARISLSRKKEFCYR
jgi:hypothetical protein